MRSQFPHHNVVNQMDDG